MTDGGRVPCKQCGKRVLPITVEKYGGMCAPCFKTAQKSSTGQVFLSYRREGGYEHVVRIADGLRRTIPPGIALFFDERRLESGKSWSDQIFNELNRSHALLCVVDPTWASSFGRRQPQSDVALREVEWALDNKRAVLPLLVGGASMPSSDKLPKSLAPLTRIQAMSVGERSFSRDVTALAQRIPSLITEYGDAYSAGFLHGSTARQKAPFYAGTWTVEMKRRGDTRRLELTIRDGTLSVRGTYEHVSQRVKRSFEGEYTLAAQSAGGLTAITGINLRLFVDQLGKLDITIPLADKRGDTYVGTTPDGFTSWARRVDGW